MNSLNITEKVRGEFNLIVTRGGGNKENYKFRNLILNNAFSKRDNFSYCTVGSGASEPLVTDTALTNRIGSNISSLGTSQELAPSWDGSICTVSRKTTFGFSSGAIVGNVSEIAIYGSSSIVAANIIIKSLVKDTEGNPTTITISAEDQLTVEHTIFVQTETRPAPVVMNIKGVDYTVSMIIAYPEAGKSSIDPNSFPSISTSSNTARFNSGASLPNVGEVGYASPTGSNFTFTPTIAFNHSNSTSGYSEATISGSIPTSTQLTGGGGIGAITLGGSSQAKVAILFNPQLPKDNTVGYKFDLKARLERV